MTRPTLDVSETNSRVIVIIRGMLTNLSHGQFSIIACVFTPLNNVHNAIHVQYTVKWLLYLLSKLFIQ